MPVTGIDINRDNTIMVVTSKDCFAYMISLKNTPQVIQKLSFKNQPNTKNMLMRSCIIRRDNSVYTLVTEARKPSYLIKWNLEQKEN